MTDGNNRTSSIILTGMSGSGKTVALNAFEDSGYYCVDNLPMTLIGKIISLSKKTPGRSRIAIGVDIRERKNWKDFPESVASLRSKHKVKIIFLEATDEAIIRRFKETRRPHPLGDKDLKKAVRREAKLLSPIRQEADSIIDTSAFTPHQLRKHITEYFLKKRPREMVINLISFGYKYGIPTEADLLFDVRFLPNPYFIQELRRFPGTSPKVKKFVLSREQTSEFLKKLYTLLDYIIPYYKQEGRSYLTIGIGCTGGMHRSPAVATEVERTLKKKKLKTTLAHRDIKESF
jgi:UPF0042 nucleotide-binding protein